MPRIDEMPEYRSNKPRYTHDLSHKFGFTATVAHLLPVFHDFLNAGETIKIGFNYNLRTQPLQAAAMIDINAHVEYFFVPMQLLYEPFGSMYYNIKDLYSSNYIASNVQKDFPVVMMDPASTPDGYSFNEQMQSDDTYIVGYEDWLNHCYRLFDHIGWNNTEMNQTLSNSNHNPNVFPYQLLAYHCIYQYYYRLDSRESFNQNDFNWDRFFNTPVVSANNVDYKRLFRLHYRPQDSDYFNDVKVSPIVDALNLLKPNLNVINDWLTRNNYKDTYNDQVPVLKSGRVGDSTDNYSGAPGNSSPYSSITTNFGFNSARINPVFGVNHEIPINGLDINTANIRAMFAAEKLWSITGRARKHYDDQTLAHFGFHVPHDVKHEISCFGHDRGQIHIGEVISTSNVSVDSGGSISGSGGLGEIAGKGYGQLNSKVHTFTAPCHGVVMAILSFTPVLTYTNYYLKCNAVTNRYDLFTPEYDHLGMQPLFGYEGNVDTYNNWNNIIGWQYRYEQWKRRFNRVSKAFAGVGSLDSWMLDFYAPTSVNTANTDNYLQYCYVPQSLNQVMLVNYVDSVPTGDETKCYDGDPFVIDSYIYCKKVSTMSDYSLPKLDA